MGSEILCAEGALTVRRFREGDLPALAALLADPEVMRWLEPPFDRARAAEFLRTAGLSEPPLIYAAEEDGPSWATSSSTATAAKTRRSWAGCCGAPPGAGAMPGA